MDTLQNVIAHLVIRARLVSLGELREEDGQTLVEYALILFLIAIVVVGVLIALSGQISSTFTSITNSL